MSGYLPDGCIWPSDADYYQWLNAIDRSLDEPEEFDELERLHELEEDHLRQLEQDDAELLDWSEKHGHYK